MSVKRRLASVVRLRKTAKTREAAAICAVQEARQAARDAQLRLSALRQAADDEHAACRDVTTAGAAAASARFVQRLARQAEELERGVARCQDTIGVRRAAVEGIRQHGQALAHLEERLMLLHERDERAREQEVIDQWGQTAFWREAKP